MRPSIAKYSSVEQIGQTLEKYGIDVKNGGVGVAAVTLIVGLVQKGTISTENMQTCIDTLVYFYDSHPVIMSSIGLGIGTLFILDSLHDMKEVNRFHEELVNAFTKYPLESWKQRLTEIRRGVDALKTRQLTMGMLKFLASISFGYVSWVSSAAMWARGALALGAGLSGTAAIVNGVNYYNMDALVKLLEQDSHLA